MRARDTGVARPTNQAAATGIYTPADPNTVRSAVSGSALGPAAPHTKVAAHLGRNCTQRILFFGFLKGDHFLNTVVMSLLVFCKRIAATET